MDFLRKLMDYNSSRYRLLEENRLFAKSVEGGALVLDAGAGEQPYRPLFSHARYEAADFEEVDKPYAKSTYVCDLRDIPVEDGRFDYILFNQVMEHLPEPRLVLKELHRVLKPGGKMIYTGPLFYEEHEVPYDFYRYTQYGLKELFTAIGFHIVRMDWMEGYFGTLGYQLNRMWKYLPLHPAKLGGGLMGVACWPLVLFAKVSAGLLSILFHRMEMRNKYVDRGYPKNYVAVVQKRV